MFRNSLLSALAIVVLTLGIFSTATAEAQTAQPKMSVAFGAVAINVSDIPRSEKFYSEVFGMVRTFQYPPEGTPIEIGLGVPGQVGGMGFLLSRLTDDPLPEGKSAYGRIIINTDDARGLADRMVAAGSTLLRDVGPPNGPVILFLDDPDGYEIELYQAAPSRE